MAFVSRTSVGETAGRGAADTHLPAGAAALGRHHVRVLRHMPARAVRVGTGGECVGGTEEQRFRDLLAGQPRSRRGGCECKVVEGSHRARLTSPACGSLRSISIVACSAARACRGGSGPVSGRGGRERRTGQTALTRRHLDITFDQFRETGERRRREQGNLPLAPLLVLPVVVPAGPRHPPREVHGSHHQKVAPLPAPRRPASSAD